MTKQELHTLARCAECDEVYRVPRRDHTYTCKVCGGAVRVDAEGEAPRVSVLAGMVTCAGCGAVNSESALHCAECGDVLGQALILPRSEEAQALREEASRALRRAYRWIDGVTWIYRLGALAYVVVTMFAVLALAQVEVPVRAGVQVVCTTALLAVLLLMGALHILFKPLAWTVTIALLASGVAVFHAVGPNPLGLALPASAGLAVLLWAALVPTYRFHQLIARHKDLYILHHASLRTRHALMDRSAEDRHERLLGAMRRAARRAWKVSAAAAGAICLVSALGTYMVLGSMRPADLPAAVMEFEAAWNDAGAAAALALLDPTVRAQESAWLAGVIEGHGWGDALPRISDGRARVEESDAWVDYDAAGLPLSTHWVLADLRWTLVHVELPAPPLAPILDDFLQGWRDSDPAAICAHFSAETRERTRASVEAAVRDRGWSRFPRVLDTRRQDADGEVVVTLVLEDGEASTRWYVRPDGTWGLNHLKFPKR